MGFGRHSLTLILLAWVCCLCAPAQDAVDADAPYRLVFVGDVCFGESYAQGIAKKRGANLLQEMGYDYSFEKVDPLLSGADQVVANLETVVPRPRRLAHSHHKQYRHWSAPEATAAALRRHGLTVVSLGNNHSMDQGPDGLTESLKHLADQKILSFGAGLDSAAAARPWETQMAHAGKQRTVLVVGAFEHRDSYAERFRFYATDEQPGVNVWSAESALAQMQALRAANPDALIIAYPHWGRNYVWRNELQIAIAHALVDGGADLVIGHGSHHIQEIERYKDRWILYSIGNFVMNTPGRFGHLKATPYSVVAALEFDGSGPTADYSLSLYPIFTDNLVTDYQPRPVTAEELVRIHALLLAKSPDPELLQTTLTTGTDTRGAFLRLPLALPAD